jgi:hypothetical protein
MHTIGLSMSKLTDAGIVDLVWSEDENGVYADGNQSYEIEFKDNGICELAVFQGPKCVKIIECTSISHAYSVIISGEAVCVWNIAHGETGHGYKVTAQGWKTKERV